MTPQVGDRSLSRSAFTLRRTIVRALRNFEMLPDWYDRPLSLRLFVGAISAVAFALTAVLASQKLAGAGEELLSFIVCAIAWTLGRSAGLVSAIIASMVFVMGMFAAGSGEQLSGAGLAGVLVLHICAHLTTAWFCSTARTLLRQSTRRVAAVNAAVGARDELEARLLQANQDLTASNEELANAVKAHDRFLASMSHEIRTPLNGVLGLLRVLTQTDLSPRQREFAGGAARSAERLLNLVNELLNMGLSAPTTVDKEAAAFDMSELISNTIETYSAIAEEKGIVLAANYGERVPRFVRGPQRAIEQVLNNLLSNSMKFTERGGVWVIVEGTMRIGGSVDFRISVVDSGRGMTADEVAHVFDGKGRSDPSERERRNGAGLGLGIARALVEGMQGTLEASSELGKGSRFDLQFRLALDQRVRHFAQVQESSGTPGVLLIGPEDTDMNALQEMLRGNAVWTDQATTSEKALTFLEEVSALRPYDLVILVGDHNASDTSLRTEVLRQGTAVMAIELSDAGISELFLSGVALLGAFGSREVAAAAELADMHFQRLRRLAEEREAVRVPVATPRMNRALPSPDGALRALIVDDEPMNLLVLRELLTMLGVESESADSGELAIRRLEEQSYPIVFMDMRMPTMSGIEATRRIRTSEVRRHVPPVPIIATTANTSESDRAAVLEAGMNDFLAKPVNPVDLAAILDRWRISREATRPAVTSRPAAPVRQHDEAAELMDVFLSSGASRLADLHRAIAEGDYEAASLAAHTLKSMSRHMGFEMLAEVSAELEATVETLSPEMAKEMADRASSLFGEVQGQQP
ncbi:MAG: response regulator [Gemmatimonas sp.]